MQASVIFNQSPWQQQFFTIKSGQLTGHVDLNFKLTQGIVTATNDVTGLTFRTNSQMASGNTITYSSMFMKLGTLGSWTPAPEDNLAIPFGYAYAPYYVYQESNRPSNEKVMSLNNGSQYFGLQQGSPSIITISNLDDGFYDPYWTVIKNGEIVASDGFHIMLASSQKLVVSSYPEDQYARIYNPDGSYVDVSQLQDFSKTNFVQIPEGSSTIIFYLSLNADVNITFKEERLLV